MCIRDRCKVDREYEHIRRPAPAVAKTSLSLDITRILNDQTIPDDEKVKLYANALRRYVSFFPITSAKTVYFIVEIAVTFKTTAYS